MSRGFCTHMILSALTCLLLFSAVSEAKRYDVALSSSNVLFVTADTSAAVLRLELPQEIRNGRLDYALLDLTFATTVAPGRDGVMELRIAPLDGINTGDRSYVVRDGDWPGQTLVTENGTRSMRIEVTRLLREWRRNDGALELVVERRDDIEGAHLVLAGEGGGISGTLRVYVTERQ